MISCGAVVSEDPVNGVKCAHVTKLRDKYPVLLDVCKSLEYTNPDTNEVVKTGSLITINSIVENDKVRDHYMNVTQDPGIPQVYYPYAFIGLRKHCMDCNFFWENNQPLTFTNWYGNDPDYSNYDCTWMWMTAPYNGEWTDWPCSSAYNGICHFFPSGVAPTVEKPVLPNRAGCKPDWWPFAGYCYKEFGLRVDDNGAMDTNFFTTYLAGNTSCNNEWDGARMAMMPSRAHNSMVASLLGPSLFGSDVWVGIYSWGSYDYYFRFSFSYDYTRS